jgi:hypothetical protein
MNPTSPEVTSELVEDNPILMHGMCEQLELDQAVDAVMPRHGKPQGLSLGQMLVAWLTHILSQGDHHMYPVRAYAGQPARVETTERYRASGANQPTSRTSWQ